MSAQNRGIKSSPVESTLSESERGLRKRGEGGEEMVDGGARRSESVRLVNFRSYSRRADKETVKRPTKEDKGQGTDRQRYFASSDW